MNPALPPVPGTTIPVHAYPKSPKNSVEGWVEDASGQHWLKVRITAPPEDGKANAALIKYLAKEWGVPSSSLNVVSGQNARYKKLVYQP